MPYVQKTVFHLAAKLSLIDVLKEADEKDLNTRDEDGRTPIHYASLKGHLTALKLILVRGGKVNKSDLFGNSTLHYAVRGKCLSCVSFLINYEPKLILKMDNNLQSAIELARILQYNEIFLLLSTFCRKYFTMKLSEVFKIQLQEIEHVRKRRRRNEQKMRKNEKSFLNNSEISSRKNAFKSSSSYSLGKKAANNRIIVDENVTLCNLKPLEDIKSRENAVIRDCSNTNVSIPTTQLLNMSANQVSFA